MIWKQTQRKCISSNYLSNYFAFVVFKLHDFNKLSYEYEKQNQILFLQRNVTEKDTLQIVTKEWGNCAITNVACKGLVEINWACV